jgi:hypothetical protein
MPHWTELYKECVNEIKTRGLAFSPRTMVVMEKVCEYHNCTVQKCNMEKKEIYLELAKYYDASTINVIFSILNSIATKTSTYEVWIPYLEVFYYVHKGIKL